MQGMAQRVSGEELAYPTLPMVTTTLYDLIEAICEETDPDDDSLVADIIVDLLNKGRIKFLNPMGELAILLPWLN